MNGACKSNRLCQALTDRSKIKNKFKTDFYTSKLAFQIVCVRTDYTNGCGISPHTFSVTPLETANRGAQVKLCEHTWATLQQQPDLEAAMRPIQTIYGKAVRSSSSSGTTLAIFGYRHLNYWAPKLGAVALQQFSKTCFFFKERRYAVLCGAHRDILTFMKPMIFPGLKKILLRHWNK